MPLRQPIRGPRLFLICAALIASAAHAQGPSIPSPAAMYAMTAPELNAACARREPVCAAFMSQAFEAVRQSRVRLCVPGKGDGVVSSLRDGKPYTVPTGGDIAAFYVGWAYRQAWFRSATALQSARLSIAAQFQCSPNG